MHQNSECATSTLALALSLKLLAVPVSPSGPAFDEDHVKKVCKVAKTLADVECVALSNIKSLINHVSAVNEVAAKVNLAAASAKTANSSTLYAAASGQAARCATDTTNALVSLAPIASSAATNSTKRSGHISEEIDILRQASKYLSTSKCIVQNEVSTATAASTVTAYGCTANILEKTEEKAAVDTNVLDNKGFKTLSAATTLHSSSGTSSCIFLAGGNDAAAHLWKANGAAGTPVHIAQDFITVTPDSTTTTRKAQIPQLNALGNTWSAPDTTTAEKFYNKIGELARHTHNSCGDSLDEVHNAILAPDKPKEALLAIVKKPKGAAVKQTEDEIATALINSVEPAGAKQTQKLKEKILNTMVPELVKASKTQAKLRTLKYPGEIQTSTLAAIQELKTKVETESSTESCKQPVATNQAQEEFCNAIGDANKDKCNNEKQCSYDDSKDRSKKCKFDVEKAKAKGATVTQAQTGGTETTTRNCKGKLQK
uniref:Variant surface glycoprotein n=1 Tax=Trypanosoma brucei TaxID=5691 RepID=A0A1V0FY08_9TRYP|nr:variant surface glycoprotein [Trypanosoma brucei]